MSKYGFVGREVSIFGWGRFKKGSERYVLDIGIYFLGMGNY